MSASGRSGRDSAHLDHSRAAARCDQEDSDLFLLHAELSRDRVKLDELWEPILKTWFTGGKDDPRITVIEVTPTAGYYWDNKHGNVVAGAKMLVGAAIGKTLDDSIEGRLDFQAAV